MLGNYSDYALMFKALSDETRLKIIDMLSCGELCACELLKNLEITQPTLSYHMKIMTACGIVTATRDGAWMHYELNRAAADGIKKYWEELTGSKDICICRCDKQNRCC